MNRFPQVSDSFPPLPLPAAGGVRPPLLAVIATMSLLATVPWIDAAEDVPAQIDQLMEEARWSEALPLVERWIARLERSPSPDRNDILSRARARQVLGSIQDRLGRHDVALKVLEQALEDYGLGGGSAGEVAACADEAGRAAEAAGDYARAEKWLREAVASRSREGESGRALGAASKTQLAEVLLKGGRLDEAEPLLHEATEEAGENMGVRFLVERGLGVLAHTSGAFGEALRHYEAARIRAGPLGSEAPALLASLDDQMGQSLFRLNRSDEAERRLESAATYFSAHSERADELAATTNNLATLWLALGKHELARDRLRSLLRPVGDAVATGPPAITLWLNLGAAAHRGAHLDEAATALDEARKLAGRFLPQVHPLRAQLALAEAALARDRGRREETAAKASVASQQSLAWLGSLAAAGDEARLLEFRRTLDPVSPLAALAPQETGALADAVMASQGAALDQVLRWRKWAAQAGPEGIGQWRSGSIAAASIPPPAWNPQTWREVAEALPADAALVNYVWWRPCGPQGMWETDGHYGALVLRRSREPVWEDLGPAPLIESRIRRVITSARDTIAANAEATDHASLAFQLTQLWQLAWTKVAPHVASSSRIILRPDGMLQFVPWAVLRDPEAAGKAAAFFCELYPRVEVVAFPRSSVAPATPAPHHWRVLAVENAPAAGAPKVPARVLPPLTTAVWKDILDMPALPGVRREVQAVRAAAGDGIVVDTPTPNESALLPDSGPQPEVVHFCGHGFASEDSAVNSVVPLQAGLVMGDCAAGLRALVAGKPRPLAEDGLLFAAEAAALPLSSTRLIVLSGCQTGLGHWQPGEHLAGLRHAFLVAGAGHVASTLWDLNDARAPELVRLFYAHLADDDAPPAALWQAQREWLASAKDTGPGLRAALAGAWMIESAGW